MLAVCIPALNEASTIGEICSLIQQDNNSLITDLLVIDGGSDDGTPEIAEKSGARVIEQSNRLGKGAALYESVLQTEAEIIVWCDADLIDFTPDIISKLATPLIDDPSVMLVKGFYENRELYNSKNSDGKNTGGRTSWLMARPLLSLLFPELAFIKEPLSGEYAIRRTAGEQVPFVCNYGVEIGLLIDIYKKFGVKAISEINIGTKKHKNRPLEELSIQAMEILQTTLIKSEYGSTVINESLEKTHEKIRNQTLRRPGFEDVEIEFQELPPIKPN